VPTLKAATICLTLALSACTAEYKHTLVTIHLLAGCAPDTNSAACYEERVVAGPGICPAKMPELGDRILSCDTHATARLSKAGLVGIVMGGIAATALVIYGAYGISQIHLGTPKWN